MRVRKAADNLVLSTDNAAAVLTGAARVLGVHVGANEVEVVDEVVGVPVRCVEDGADEGARIIDVIDVDDNDNGLTFGDFD